MEQELLQADGHALRRKTRELALVEVEIDGEREQHDISSVLNIEPGYLLVFDRALQCEVAW